jgi:N-carbamoylputrescine amidase
MPETIVAVTQMACSQDLETNLDRAERLIRQAAGQGARIVLLQELFAGPYFCQDQDPNHFRRANEVDGHPWLPRFSALAKELGVVLPVSFFEKAGPAHYNSLAMIDADGRALGVYRKAHIPDGPGYREKYYFSPGDTGFRVWRTSAGVVGAGICWDQWFPEAARAMTLMGADILMYPTAIGSEPADPSWDSSGHWTRVMQGHAGANLIPVAASNRVGREEGRDSFLRFYGSSFIAGPLGEILVQADRDEETLMLAAFDFDRIRELRTSWGVFRDRRPDLYGVLGTLDGRTPVGGR